MSDLKKSVWITGASSGIGKHLTIEFAKNGETVLATARRTSLIENYSKELGEFSKNIIPFEVNVSDVQSIQNFFNSLSEKFFVSALINNAGITSFKPAEKDSLQEIKEIVDTNLLGSIYAIKTVLPAMIENNSGTIINILSVVTQKVFTGSSAYSASKAGLKAYADSLREEIRKNNIRVINILPGAAKTAIWHTSVLEKHSHRMMSPEDIAKFVYQVYSQKNNLVAEEIVMRPLQGDI